MIEQKSYIFDAYTYGFKTFFAQFKLVVLSILASASIFIVAAGICALTLLPLKNLFFISPKLVLAYLQLNPHLLIFVIFILFYVFIWIFTGFSQIALNVYAKGTASPLEMYTCFPKTLKTFIAGAIFFIIFFLGLILFIVPGIIWAVRAGQFMFLILDKNAGIIESFKKSFELTKTEFWPLFAAKIINVVLHKTQLLSPVSFFANVHIYHHLQQKAPLNLHSSHYSVN